MKSVSSFSSIESISTRKVVWGLSPVLTMFSPYGDVTIAGGEELKP